MDYNKFSNYFGMVAHYKFPKFIQKQINSWYVKKFNIDMSEFDDPDSFDSLNALFTRTLKKQRILGDGFISPSDGVVFECGTSENLQAISIKNKTYNIDELLENSFCKNELKDGLDYVNIYLSPKDYHHYHAPYDMQILSAHYIKGELFSVAKKYLYKIDNLYAKNERVIIRAKLPNHKLMWMIFVGALNVGKINLSFEKRIKTNAKFGNASYDYNQLYVKKGDRLGNFELGSTIVMISQKNCLKYQINKNDLVKFGDRIGKLAG